MTIGEKRPQRAPEDIPGPGVYEFGQGLVKPNNPMANFAFSPGRIDMVPEPVPGPGAYVEQTPKSKAMTIGVKREQRTPEDQPGPGYYAHEQADPIVKPKGPETDFRYLTGRKGEKADPNHGPGHYDLQNNFCNETRPMTIGEKRP